MADTRVLKRDVEPFVRKRLEAEFGQPFTQQFLPVGRRADGYTLCTSSPASHSRGNLMPIGGRAASDHDGAGVCRWPG